MHVRHTCMGTWVRAAAGLVSPRTRGRVLVGLIPGEQLNAGNPTLIVLRDPSLDHPGMEVQENWREFSFSADSYVRKVPCRVYHDASEGWLHVNLGYSVA